MKMLNNKIKQREKLKKAYHHIQSYEMVCFQISYPVNIVSMLLKKFPDSA